MNRNLFGRGVAVLAISVALGVLPLLGAEQAYLAPGRLDPVELLAPPPMPGSPEQAADMAEVEAAHKAITPEQVAIVKSEIKFSVFSFAPEIGEFFQPTNLPKTAALFTRVQQDMKAVTDEGKNHWKRPRPFVANPALTPIDPDKTYSYPSGHSTRGTVYSLLLAELFPDKREAILGEGRDVGWHRVLGASHYPTDIYAGRVLGRAIVRELKASPEFQKDWVEVKAEVEAVRKKETANAR